MFYHVSFGMALSKHVTYYVQAFHIITRQQREGPYPLCGFWTLVTFTSTQLNSMSTFSLQKFQILGLNLNVGLHIIQGLV
jgi:hypothetical protein